MPLFKGLNRKALATSAQSLAADVSSLAANVKEAATLGAGQLAANVKEAATLASISAEMVYVEQQIANLKAAWGKANFELAVAGDFAPVAQSTAKYNLECGRLQAQLAALQTKRAIIKGEQEAQSTAVQQAVPVQQMKIAIPPSATPGTVLMVQLADGSVCQVTVPPGTPAGAEVEMDMPLLLEPVVQGIPLATPMDC